MVAARHSALLHAYDGARCRLYHHELRIGRVRRLQRDLSSLVCGLGPTELFRSPYVMALIHVTRRKRIMCEKMSDDHMVRHDRFGRKLLLNVCTWLYSFGAVYHEVLHHLIIYHHHFVTATIDIAFHNNNRLAAII